MLRKVKGVLIGIAPLGAALISAPAFASGPLTTAASAVSLADGTAAVIALFGIVAVGLAVLWGIRKCIKTQNRS